MFWTKVPYFFAKYCNNLAKKTLPTDDIIKQNRKNVTMKYVSLWIVKKKFLSVPAFHPPLLVVGPLVKELFFATHEVLDPDPTLFFSLNFYKKRRKKNAASGSGHCLTSSHLFLASLSVCLFSHFLSFYLFLSLRSLPGLQLNQP